MSRMFRIDDQQVQVSVRRDGDGYKVSLDGSELPYVVRPQGEGWVVDTPRGRRRLAVLVTPDRCEVFAEGRVYGFAKPDPDLDDAAVDLDRGPRLIADMPGKVVKVLVEVGDEVTDGQPLVIMESMKMETELSTAVAGTVAEVAVAAGEVVGQGDLLVLVDPVDEES